MIENQHAVKVDKSQFHVILFIILKNETYLL